MKSPFYINVNGAYGLGAYEKPDYCSLEELLKDMDRLGIGQVVTYHNLARDLHPVHGNRYLMKDIADTPGAKERVIPAFAVNPSMLCAEGEMESVEKYLASGEVSCLVLFPKTNRYCFAEIERVLERFRKYKPVVLVDVTELNPVINAADRAPSMDLEAVVEAARHFPEISFVIRKVMWWQFSHMLSVLARTDNVYMDTSWLHTRDAIMITQEQAGRGRMVFGLGAKCHNGAAIAGLAYAHITQEEMDAVAWDTFAGLLNDAGKRFVEANKRSMDNTVKNGFWNKFISGEGVKDALVIDAHTHIGPFARSWVIPCNEFDGQIKEFEEDMERFGIDEVCSQSESELFGSPVKGNKELETAIGDRKDRFHGNLVINPIYAEMYTDEILDEFFAGGYYKGMKLIPGYIGVDIRDSRLDSVFTYANRHKLYILIHSWADPFSSADNIAEVALKYPDATWIIGHMGGPTEGRHQCERIAQDPKYKNVIFEFCGSFTTEVPVEESLKYIDYRRLVFGTDTVVHDVAWELGRLLSMDIPDEWLKEILGNNMKKVLNRVEV